jgi:hypothetical protein
MNFVALRMLTGDRAKYVGLIFAIAFSTFLLENQSSIFAGMSITTFISSTGSCQVITSNPPLRLKKPAFHV